MASVENLFLEFCAKEVLDQARAEAVAKTVVDKYPTLGGWLRAGRSDLIIGLNAPDAQYVVDFVKSIRLSAKLLEAIGLRPAAAESVFKALPAGYETVQEIVDGFKNEGEIESKLGIEPPPSTTLWNFIAKWKEQQGESTIKLR